jgi:hypothetical protein
MYCTNCGSENPAEANFCGQCGRPLPRPGDATTGALRLEDHAHDEAHEGDLGGAEGELDPGTALLVVVRGPNNGARFLIDRDVVTVGRHPDSDIFLDDITVSRRHVEFRRTGGRVLVVDTGSLNGTYVNGTRVDEQALATNDEVQIGKFKLVALLAEPEA